VTSAATCTAEGIAWHLPAQAENAVGASVLQLLAEQHHHLVAHVLMQSAEQLASCKAAVLCALGGAASEPQRAELLRCQAVTVLHTAARHAASLCHSAKEQRALLDHCCDTISAISSELGLSRGRTVQALEAYYGAKEAIRDSLPLHCAAALVSLEAASPVQARSRLLYNVSAR
jgi:hypothetical protein